MYNMNFTIMHAVVAWRKKKGWLDVSITVQSSQVEKKANGKTR
jgi:hypothetical protein